MKLVNKRAKRKAQHIEARKQHEHDNYETVVCTVTSLLQREPIWGKVLDPCCGRGVIGREVRRVYPHLELTEFDIRCIPEGPSPFGNIDFVNMRDPYPEFDFAIFNPPFKLTTAFILQALKCTRHAVYAFQRTNLLETKARYEKLWSVSPLAHVWVAVPRWQCYPEGEINLDKSGSIAFAWYVFRHGHVGRPTVGWINDPITYENETRLGFFDAVLRCKPKKRAAILAQLTAAGRIVEGEYRLIEEGGPA